MKRVKELITTILIVLCIIYLIVMLLPRLLGYDINVVLSNSMEPVYSTGELLLVKHAEPKDVKVGDIISFDGRDGAENVITHRVIRIDSESQVFYTKGDANEGEDSNPATFKRLNGIVMVNIPMAGHVYALLQSIQFRIVMAIAVIGYIILGLIKKGKS